MPHIGTPPVAGFKTTTKQSFSGDNSTVAFTLNRASSSETDLEVFVDNIQQEPTTAYSVSGTTLTFTEAPPTGTNNIYVVNRGGDQNGLLPPQDLGTTDYIFGDDISFNSDGAVINFGADSDINLTHVADTGLTTNNDFSLKSDSSVLKFGNDEEITVTHVADTGLNLKHTATGDDKPIVLTLQTGETDIAADDVIGKINFQAPDEGTGTDAILVAAGIQAISEGDISSSANATSLQFMTGASEAATAKASITSGGDVKVLTDGASIFFGADSEIELRHVADDGLILKHVGTADGKEPSLTFQAGDNDIAADDVLGSIFFQAPDEGAGTDAILVSAGIEAVSEGAFSSSSNATSLVFKTGASEAAAEKMRINSAGKIGLGTTDIDAALDIVNSDEFIRLAQATTDNTSKQGGIVIRHRDNEEEDLMLINGICGSSNNVVNIGGSDFIGNLNAATQIAFFTAADRTTTVGTRRMLVASDGSVALGHANDPTADASVGVSVTTNSNNDTIHTINNNTATGTGSSTSREHQAFRRAGTQVGAISSASSATTYGTSSDYRIKENVNYSFDATTDLKKLKPCKFNFKDVSSETIIGFLAHEAAEVVPNSVIGEKDATITKTDSDGKSVTEIKAQNMDHSKLVPLLVKTIQELETRIATLESG